MGYRDRADGPDGEFVLDGVHDFPDLLRASAYGVKSFALRARTERFSEA